MKLTKQNFSKRKLPKSKNVNNYVIYQVTIKSLKERTKDKLTRMSLSVINTAYRRNNIKLLLLIKDIGRFYFTEA